MPEASETVKADGQGETLKEKLSSRKFWAYVLYSIVNCVLMLRGVLVVKEGMSNYLWVTCFYLFGQGVADMLKNPKVVGLVASILPALGEVKGLLKDLRKKGPVK